MPYLKEVEARWWSGQKLRTPGSGSEERWLPLPQAYNFDLQLSLGPLGPTNLGADTETGYRVSKPVTVVLGFEVFGLQRRAPQEGWFKEDTPYPS